MQLESEIELSAKERGVLSETLDETKTAITEEKDMLISLQSELEEKSKCMTSLQKEVEAKDALLAVSSEEAEKERKSLQTQLEEQIAALAGAEDDMETLNTELTEIREQSEDVVHQWKGMCSYQIRECRLSVSHVFLKQRSYIFNCCLL